MRVPYQDCFHLIEPLLAKVEKPSRYIDHEWGTLSKADADYRCCMIYPDVYEVGLPNQGIAILYNILNQAPRTIPSSSPVAPRSITPSRMRPSSMPS